MVFANAIFGTTILKQNIAEDFRRLQAHIRRGLSDIPAEELPMITKGEQLIYKYAAGGDVMLLEYCDLLNSEVLLKSSIAFN